MKLRHAAIAVSIVAVVALVAYARNSQEPGAAKASPSPAAGASVAASPGAAAAAAADDPRLLYALGVFLGQNLKVLNLSASELDQVKAGLVDSATGKKTDIDPSVYGPKLQQFGASRVRVATEAEKSRGQAFRDAAAKEAGAVLTPSGLVYKETAAGTGRGAAASDTVRVHYRGTLIDGTEFDSSIGRGEPAEFPLNGVIPCWTEGVQRMKVGGKARLVCPAAIAYGDQGRPPQIPGGATLVFDVELLDVKAAAAPAPGASPAATRPASPGAAAPASPGAARPASPAAPRPASPAAPRPSPAATATPSPQGL
ncbi:MAG TPA: FKBP-type peptidyl-prolyl cis-trans isomerase [Vicinamibacteria bacterium]|nr:FKBP-type peptidyl-prolyl cis-trans isomerase [Vicinamibacteria bacterium]